MAFNGSGVFVRLYNWVTDHSNSVPVTDSRMDGEMDGFATGLSNAICRDGQSTATARIPFGSGVSASGSVSSVAYSQTNDIDTGIYFPSTNQVGIAAGGTGTVVVTATGATATGTFAVTGDFTINTNKFIVTASSGNTTVGGSLS